RLEKNDNKFNEQHDHDNQSNHDHSSHQDHSGHGEHDHHGHHDHGDMVSDFKKRFFISLIVTIPILALSPMIQDFMGVDWRFTNDQYILFVLATVVFFYGGWPFITGGIRELKDKNPGMMTVIGLAITIAYGYRAFVVFGCEDYNLFCELTTFVDTMLLGHWIEMRSVIGASNALEQLVKLMPNEEHTLENNDRAHDVPLSELKHEDL